MRRCAFAGATALLSLGSAGCFDFDSSWEPTDPQPYTPPPTAAESAPFVSNIAVPDFPPIGPTGSVVVQVADADGNLKSVAAGFKHQVVRNVSGGHASAAFSGAELGEGYGPLNVTVLDSRLWGGTRQASPVLVDLTPPKIVLGQTVIPQQGHLELWVGDAWVLGKAELKFAGKVLEHTFEPGWPATVGVTWDYSLVKFPAVGLPELSGLATIIATDAAGNTKTETFTLAVDGTPPEVIVVEPSEGATISGAASVSVQANDPGNGPVFVEVTLDGTPVGNLTGGTCALTLNTAELLPGPATIAVTATDQAGNQNVVTRNVVVK